MPSITQANLDIWTVKDIETLLEKGETADGDTIGKSMAVAVYVKMLAALPGEKEPD